MVTVSELDFPTSRLNGGGKKTVQQRHTNKSEKKSPAKKPTRTKKAASSSSHSPAKTKSKSKSKKIVPSTAVKKVKKPVKGGGAVSPHKGGSAGGQIVKNVSHLAVPFMLTLVKKGLDNYVETTDRAENTSSSKKPSVALKSPSSTFIRRRAAVGGTAAAAKATDKKSRSRGKNGGAGKNGNSKIPKKGGGTNEDDDDDYKLAAMNGGGHGDTQQMHQRFINMTAKLDRVFAGAHPLEGNGPDA
jgi:hypothetical protein